MVGSGWLGGTYFFSVCVCMCMGVCVCAHVCVRAHNHTLVEFVRLPSHL